MALKNKKKTLLMDAIKLSEKSLDLYSAVDKRKQVNSVKELTDKIVIRNSNDPSTNIAVNIIKRMLTATFRSMKKPPEVEKRQKIIDAINTIRKGHEQGLVSDNDFINANLKYEKLSQVNESRYRK